MIYFRLIYEMMMMMMIELVVIRCEGNNIRLPLLNDALRISSKQAFHESS